MRKIVIAASLALGASLLGAQARDLKPEQVVSLALANDERVQSALFDEKTAEDKAKEADLRMLPGLSLAGGYTRLSDLPTNLSSLLSNVPAAYASYVKGLEGISIPSLDNEFSLSANLQYPVFQGFRLRETAHLAKIQLQGKEITTEMIRRSIVFEAQRAYWEAKRATENVALLKENLELANQNLAQEKAEAEEGTALKSDVLAAQMRADQSQIDLDQAVAAQRRAFWNLEELVDPPLTGGASESDDPQPETKYNLGAEPQPVADDRFPSLEESALVGLAMNNRPETKASALTAVAAGVAKKIAQAPLYPTLSISGSYLYADPNPRNLFQTDASEFTGTWSVGASLSYDLGGLPANLAEVQAQTDNEQKTQADDLRQRQTIILDVRTCLQSFVQARKDYTLLSGMVQQAQENERETEQKLAAGSASSLDMLTAKLSRLRVEFSVTNKLIDEQIAAADLERAAALAKL